VFTPGPAPFRGLGHALAPELGSDPEALRMLVDVDDPAAAFELATRWRKAHAEALLVVDQFEELFTLGSREVQASFTGLLGRLAREADVHVLLSMRDDFLIRCSEQPPIAPVFESLTPLAPLSGEALRRAVVAPAGKRGCSFEDEALVEEMLASVEGARGALPLVAFAVAQLWEKRLLTRAAYQEIGGVAGALAQHAEATLERIGVEHQAMVREVFRNLVTAQGTRAAADREELLSVFPEGKVAEDVLGTLIDARLLTSYEVPAGPGGANEATPGEEGTRHRIEIVHESLLKAWPRLVWWQAQDEEGAHLRDQLKQAAHLWEEKGRPADLLWTGTSFQEFELWRRRYPGKLTSLEEDFARSMAERARRRRRLRRLVVGSVLAAAVAVAAVTGLLWRRSELARDRAQAEARRAEASKLLALGRAELDRYPTAAVAYARKSLEIADTPEGRKLVVEALWRGPVARILSPDRIVEGPDRPANPGWGVPVFSPDAKWLALENDTIRRLLLFPWDGGAPRHVPPRSSDANAAVLGFGPQSDLLVSGGPGASVRFWSLPALQEIRRVELGGVRSEGWFGGGMLFTQTQMAPGDEQRRIRGWSLPGGEPRSLGTVDWHGVSWTSFDSEGHRLAYSSGRSVHLRRLDDASGAPSRLLGSHADAVTQVTFFPVGDRVASVDQAGEIRIWSLASHALKPWRFIHGVGGLQWLLAVDDQGTRLARGELASSVHLWDFRDPPDAEPLLLKRPDVCYAPSGAFDPRGWWLASGNAVSIAFWPLIHPWKRSFPGAHPSTYQLEFTPDGRWLASCTLNEAVRLWPLGPADGAVRSLTPSEPCWGLAAHPASTHLLVGTWPDGRLLLAPISGGAPRPLPTGWEGAATTGAMAFDPAGRRAAACPWAGMLRIKDPQHRVLRVWDLESGRGRSYSLANITDSSWMCDSVAFAPDGAVFVGGNGGVLRLTLPEDSGGTVAAETVHAAGRAAFVLSRDGRKLLVWAGRNPNAVVFDELLVFDLTAHTSRRITTHGRRLWCAAFDPTGRIVVTGDIDGVVRAGLATGEEPHLLFGHAAHVTKVAISPDGRWIVSASDDALNLWPMPDLTKPPLHTLPHAELMARLDALTNLRVARDLSSAIGWKLDVGPFPGWKDVPTW
jgi:WD40 repeat protein